MNKLPRVVVQRCLEWDLNPQPTDSKSNALPVALPRHVGSSTLLYLCRYAYKNAVLCLTVFKNRHVMLEGP